MPAVAVAVAVVWLALVWFQFEFELEFKFWLQLQLQFLASVLVLVSVAPLNFEKMARTPARATVSIVGQVSVLILHGLIMHRSLYRSLNTGR